MKSIAASKSLSVIATFTALLQCGGSAAEPVQQTATSSGFAAVLHADGPASDRKEALNLYGQFVGDWNTDIITYSLDGARHQGQGEIHFGWILQGRAIQDVWMIPRLKDRHPDSASMPVAGNFYGTTIRAYDPDLDAWHIYWIDPATNAYRQQIGRKQGADIVQEGSLPTGEATRWRFTEIKADSFHWKGEISTDKGATWRLVLEIFAHRI